MRSFNLDWMPQIRIPIPVFARLQPAEHESASVDRLQRDHLVQLFQSDLSGMQSLKSQVKRHNIIRFCPVQVAIVTERGQQAA